MKTISLPDIFFGILKKSKLLFMGRDYPKGYEFFRANLQKAFRKNRDEQNSEKIDKMLAHGEFVKKELETLYMLRKYRTLKKIYYDS
ncbi:LYR motif-containing protein 5B isoform X2 [Leptopilina heterotoma]|uniref:LYR motif-containing protein 5B isoform X2 n=1 Tax=Leptopilina heterotoma TaxID=63436 RepID=UPI001CA8A84D|nr:LYR motif-containing protein 5B isoform X2 [Leptopilina heterotoma]